MDAERALEVFMEDRTIGFESWYSTPYRWYWRGPGYDEGWNTVHPDDVQKFLTLANALSRENMKDTEAIAALDAIEPGDPEFAHGVADEIILKVVSPAVAYAWEKARIRAGGFWYT